MSKNLNHLIEHPYFDRLQHIRQMGLSYFVFPTATHTRHEHGLGALQLMKKAIKTLKNKGIIISDEEKNAMKIAILLHDIGHGPFSHALETSIVSINHESISMLLMEQLNIEFDGELSLAIDIFKGSYHRKFMHQLVSSQLDIDRLDYLKRDSFYSKIDEGNVNSEAIIAQINVIEDELVFEENAVPEIENFLLARKLMYEKVYLHKTGLVAELMLTKILQRAKELSQNNIVLEGDESVLFFIKNNINENNFDKNIIEKFVQLNDNVIVDTIKIWQYSNDFVLKTLSKMLIENDFLEINLEDISIIIANLELQKITFAETNNLTENEINYFYFEGTVENRTYNSQSQPINILTKSHQIINIDQFIDAKKLSGIKKYYICH